MTLYDVLIDLAQKKYGKIHIDLVNKTIKVGKQVILENGELKQHKIKVGDDIYEFDDLIDVKHELEDLYKQYKYSVPSERDKKSYFKALSANELSDAQLVIGMNRLEARVRLEAYIILSSIKAIETWPNANHWYWQGKDKDFVILKQYM